MGLGWVGLGGRVGLGVGGIFCWVGSLVEGRGGEVVDRRYSVG